MIADAETKRQLEANNAMCSMLGYGREELIGLTMNDIHPPEALPVIKELFEKQRLGEISLATEIPMQRKDGSVFYADINAASMTFGDKQCLIGIFRDITERKRIEEELREENIRRRQLFDRVPISIWEEDFSAVGDWLEALKARGVRDLNAYFQAEPLALEQALALVRLVDINDTTLQMFEVNSKEELLAFWSSLFTEETFRVFAEELRAIWEGRNQLDLECSAQTARGKQIHYLLHWVAPMEEGRINLRRVIVALSDITKHKLAENALKESQAMLKESQLIAGLGSYVLDIPTGFWRNTDLLDSLFGINEGFERSIEGWISLIHPDDRSMMTDYFNNEVLAKGEVFDKEYRIIRRDNQAERWMQGFGKLEFDAHGQPLKMFGTIQDITNRKKLEEQILRAQKLESISTLAGGIAHDFNNLLQGIFGYISLAKKNIANKEELLAMLAQAEEALNLSVNLTTQLLTFSKGGKPVRKPIKLNTVVEKAIKLALSGSSTNYQMSAPADLRMVEADEGQLAQVIQNIVLNAKEAMSGKGTVDISLANVDASENKIASQVGEGLLIRIDIRDSGPGIPKQHLARIFDPYFSTKERGSGLGLATSFSIIKNHGGTIEVTSEVGKDTTFSIYLPTATNAVQEEEILRINTSSKLKARILVMDDDEMVRSVAQRMIEILGHRVDTTPDGEKAVELVRHARESGKPYDIVILDLTVKGGMGGEEAIKKIREFDPQIAAVVSSGYADSSAVADFHAHGFTATLDKPYMIDSLQSCIEKLLR